MFREGKALSQKDFSDLLGVKLSTYATWEAGKSGPTPRNLRKIAEKLGVTLEWFDTPPDAISNLKLVAPIALRKIPVVSWTTAGLAQSYADLANQIDELVDATTKDPNAFALEVVGDSMEGEVHPGDRVVLEPNREASSGDMAYVRFTDEAGGGGTLKWFYRTGSNGEFVKLVPENENYKVIESPIQTILFAYPVHNVIRNRPRRRKP